MDILNRLAITPSLLVSVSGVDIVFTTQTCGRDGVIVVVVVTLPGTMTYDVPMRKAGRTLGLTNMSNHTFAEARNV